ncbi:YlxR family protein [Ruania suaedae]|uniref:YlxR family protein n=1 Tax=Ruania suaedae TaxID=2897774 RepID=UPI001E36B561|nr:YlxR family protein [Ruania suaedae]UFU04174.1 YlxR family protein [Ruania suaedae]
MNLPPGPVRTCVGCRGRDSRSTLVRLVADSSTSAPAVVVDDKASAPGRGAWVHPHPDCLDRAISRRAIARALRIPVRADCEHVVEWFDQYVRHEPLMIEQESGS